MGVLCHRTQSLLFRSSRQCDETKCPLSLPSLFPAKSNPHGASEGKSECGVKQQQQQGRMEGCRSHVRRGWEEESMLSVALCEQHAGSPSQRRDESLPITRPRPLPRAAPGSRSREKALAWMRTWSILHLCNGRPHNHHRVHGEMHSSSSMATNHYSSACKRSTSTHHRSNMASLLLRRSHDQRLSTSTTATLGTISISPPRVRRGERAAAISRPQHLQLPSSVSKSTYTQTTAEPHSSQTTRAVGFFGLDYASNT